MRAIIRITRVGDISEGFTRQSSLTIVLNGLQEPQNLAQLRKDTLVIEFQLSVAAQKALNVVLLRESFVSTPRLFLRTKPSTRSANGGCNRIEVVDLVSGAKPEYKRQSKSIEFKPLISSDTCTTGPPTFILARTHITLIKGLVILADLAYFD